MVRAHAWRLKPLQSQGAAGEVELGDEPLTLGRDPHCDVVTPAERFPQVSARHARVVPGEGGPRVEDLGSTNGTLVNGRRVSSARLFSGSVIQLGELGPSFVVLSPAGLEQTARVPAPAVSGSRSLGQTAILSLEKALGAVREGDVRAMLASSRRRTLFGAGLALALVAAGMAAYLGYAERADQRQLEDLRAQSERLRVGLQGQLDQSRARADELAQRLEQADRALQDEHQRLADFLAETRAERDRLAGRLERLEAEGTSSAGELAELRAQLDATGARLALFDPVNLAEAELSEVARVRQAVVLIEVDLSWRDPESGRTLFFDPAGGADSFNLEGRGERFAEARSGSGFCVTEHGWVVTNAHVALPEDAVPLRVDSELTVEPRVELAVVFSDHERRHPAELVAHAQGAGDDLAVVRIEPFDGMPYLPGLDLEAQPPALGSDVFLFGFPLGTQALQEGDRVIASTFKGILSRRVEPFLQVDAAVHPGNSGGPVTDAHGRVIGIVTASQRLPDDQIAYTIGYAIPIGRLASIWPPAD